MFYGMCCFSTFLRGPSTVQWSREAWVAKVLLGSCPRLLCSIVPAAAVCYGLHLAYAQPYPWSPTEAEASSLSVYSLGPAGLSDS